VKKVLKRQQKYKKYKNLQNVENIVQNRGKALSKYAMRFSPLTFEHIFTSLNEIVV
jgi:hypothetical protein